VDVHHPVAFAEPRRDGEKLVYTIPHRATLVAGITGTVEVREQDQLDGSQVLLRRQDGVGVTYGGVSEVLVRTGQNVLAGDPFGVTAPGPADPTRRLVEMTVTRDGKPLLPPETIASLYLHPGQRVFADNCAGCHQNREAGARIVVSGRLRKSGLPATSENILAKIREGGEGMPPFANVLTADQERSVVAFLQQAGSLGKRVDRTEVASLIP
jgi:mono/diheme cytochrome c family protein